MTGKSKAARLKVARADFKRADKELDVAKRIQNRAFDTYMAADEELRLKCRRWADAFIRLDDLGGRP